MARRGYNPTVKPVWTATNLRAKRRQPNLVRLSPLAEDVVIWAYEHGYRWVMGHKYTEQHAAEIVESLALGGYGWSDEHKRIP